MHKLQIHYNRNFQYHRVTQPYSVITVQPLTILYSTVRIYVYTYVCTYVCMYCIAVKSEGPNFQGFQGLLLNLENFILKKSRTNVHTYLHNLLSQFNN